MIKIIPLDSAFLQSCERFSQAPSIIGAEIAMLGRSNVGKSSLINALFNHKNLAKSSSTPGKTKLVNFFTSKWKVEYYKDSSDLKESKNYVDSSVLSDSKKVIDSKNNADSNAPAESQNSIDSSDLITSKNHADSLKNQKNSHKIHSQNKQILGEFHIRILDFPGFGYAKISKNEKKSWDRHLSEFLQKRDSIKLYIHLIDSRHENLTLDSHISSFLRPFQRGDSHILEIYTKIDKLNKNKYLLLKKQGKILTSISDKKSIENLRFAILKIMYNVDFHAQNGS